MKDKVIKFFERIIDWVRGQLDQLGNWELELRNSLVKLLEDVYAAIKQELAKAGEYGKSTFGRIQEKVA